jgi:SAM-dependent MidA family methyltransferase
MSRPDPALPVPDADARAHSARVVAHARAELAAAGGWIPLADYLQHVLYAPGLGYYAAGARKFGAAGDFVTAPEMTPLFGAALAVQVDAVLAATAGREIVEFGAGTGRLAADLLGALAARDALPSRYAIVEVSPDLADRQRATIAAAAPALAGRVEWLAGVPARIDGAVVMNEVLDAIPPHVVARRDGALLERGVVWEDAAQSFAFDDRPANPRLAALAAARFAAGIDYLSEVNPAAEALVETIGRRLAGGALLVVDYGFPGAEYYHPQRDQGTLMGHYRHRAHADPFLWPGLSDLTAHVDFSAIADAGLRAGLEVEGFTAQAPFLLGCGILEALAALGEPGTPAVLRETAAVQRLLSPAEMGELFKVLALARTPGIAWPGFALADRAHRL